VTPTSTALLAPLLSLPTGLLIAIVIVVGIAAAAMLVRLLRAPMGPRQPRPKD